MLRYAVLALFLLALPVKAFAMASLDDYQWTHRPVLMFHDGSDEACLICQTGLTGDIAEGLADRAIVFIEVTPDGTRSWVDSRSGGALDDSAADLQSRFGVAPEDIVFILIGKDGGVKARWETPPSWEEDIFPLIDAMPMRQREMQEN